LIRNIKKLVSVWGTSIFRLEDRKKLGNYMEKPPNLTLRIEPSIAARL
jgi:hypothetical protein